MSILGISAHRTTIYHSQNIAPVNNQWSPDPVQTAAMTAAVTGSDPAQAVLKAIESGTGYNLKQYYFYATRRFRKRPCEWSLEIKNSKGIFESGINKSKLLTLLPYLKGRDFRVVHDVNTFSISGPKTYEDIYKLTGWNDFTPSLADGTNVVITNIEPAGTAIISTASLGRSWVIGTETSKDLPAIILDPNIDATKIVTPHYVVATILFEPELSGGVIYWESSLGFESKSTTAKVTLLYSETEFKTLGIKYRVDAGTDSNGDPINIVVVEDTNKIEISRVDDWVDDNDNDIVIIDGVFPDNPQEERIPIKDPLENVTIKYKQFDKIVTVGNDKQYMVSYWEETGVINYDSEHYVWATEKDESHSGARNYFVSKETISKTDFSDDQKYWFKLYPYLPIKENNENLLDFSKAKPYLDALKEIQDKAKDNETEIDAPKANREGAKFNRDNQRSTSAKARRVTSNKSRYTRKIRPLNVRLITESDNRHLIKLGELLNLDYKEMAANLEINKDIDKVYHASLCPSLNLASNFDEVNEYWWEFFSRMYRKLGETSYSRYLAEINNLKGSNPSFQDALSLPRIELNYNMIHGQLGGFISFCYIRKFTISGSIRKTKRKHRLFEVKNGKLTSLYKLEGDALKHYLANPSKEMMNNTYHTSKAGKDYNIGGGERFVDVTKDGYKEVAGLSNYLGAGDNASILKGSHIQSNSESDRSLLTLANFGYTFICRTRGDGDIDVIAIAGLIAGQHSGHNVKNHHSVSMDGAIVMACAYVDIDMLHKRNKQRYIDKVATEKIDVKLSFIKRSGKRRISTMFNHMFLLPLDYKTISRMNGTNLIRLSDRAIQTLTWTKVRSRVLASWVTPIIQIIGIIIAVVAAYFGQVQVSAAILAAVKALVYSVVIQLVIKYGLPILQKVFGLKGFLATLVIIIVTIICMMVGGSYNINAGSSLPYAGSTAASNIASSVGASAQVAQQSIMSQLKAFIEEMLKQTLGDLTANTTQQLVQNSFKLIDKFAGFANQAISAEQQSMAEKAKESDKQYNDHMLNLEEIREADQELFAPYDVKKVLESLTNKTKIIPPEIYLQGVLTVGVPLATEEFLAQFLDTKISLDLQMFDPVTSLDFTLQDNKS